MTTLIFSDTHLSARVYPKKLEYLRSIIQPADKVIIAGDFWDGFLTTFDKFVNSGWNELFPLLLERQAIYIYGNHDRAEWNNQTVNLFSTQQAQSVDLTAYQQAYHITHGHTVFASYEDRFPVLNRRPFLRIGSNIDSLHKLVWGQRFVSRQTPDNDPMRHYHDQQKTSTILICGHSHYPELDLDSRIINPGFIGYGFGNYLLIDQHGPKLVKERY